MKSRERFGVWLTALRWGLLAALYRHAVCCWHVTSTRVPPLTFTRQLELLLGLDGTWLRHVQGQGHLEMPPSPPTSLLASAGRGAYCVSGDATPRHVSSQDVT